MQVMNFALNSDPKFTKTRFTCHALAAKFQRCMTTPVRWPSWGPEDAHATVSDVVPSGSHAGISILHDESILRAIAPHMASLNSLVWSIGAPITAIPWDRKGWEDPDVQRAQSEHHGCKRIADDSGILSGRRPRFQAVNWGAALLALWKCCTTWNIHGSCIVVQCFHLV